MQKPRVFSNNVTKLHLMCINDNVSRIPPQSLPRKYCLTFTIGRKNWLFSDMPRGAEASAAIYSIVVTVKLNGINQRAYLEWLLTEMPNDRMLAEPCRIDRYLP